MQPTRAGQLHPGAHDGAGARAGGAARAALERACQAVGEARRPSRSRRAPRPRRGGPSRLATTDWAGWAAWMLVTAVTLRREEAGARSAHVRGAGGRAARVGEPRELMPRELIRGEQAARSSAGSRASCKRAALRACTTCLPSLFAQRARAHGASACALFASGLVCLGTPLVRRRSCAGAHRQ